MGSIKDSPRRPTFWYLVLILLIMGWVGNMDFEDAIRHQNHYCRMVADGIWPDYDKIYKNECVALGYPAVPAGFVPDGDATR